LVNKKSIFFKWFCSSDYQAHWKNPFYFCFEKVKSNRTKATCPKFLIFKMYEEKVSEPKLNAD